MRILQLHSDFIEYEPVEREIKAAEPIEPGRRRLEELVVLFTCVEEGDDESVARRAVEGVKVSMEGLGVNRVLIYPYAHLSSSLARPHEALRVLKEMERRAGEMGIETHRTPFGWCKRFSISVKGHPLAERFLLISPGEEKAEAEEGVSEALRAEAGLKSSWFILEPDGRMAPLEDFGFSGHGNLEKFARYEMEKVRAVQRTPPHVDLMRRLELVDYEPGSDLGNFRWYPKGSLVKSLLERFVTDRVVEYGAMEVETPVMYDLQHPSLASYLNRFPARQYTMRSGDRELFLRFSACFGQFLMAHDAQLSYRQLPLKVYELTRYSFRRELSGELVGLRRLRAFTMPDCHAMCADLDQAKGEFLTRFRLSMGVLEGLGLGPKDYELAVRFTRAFYEENREFIVSLVRLFGRPALVEMWEERFFYFVLKWEFNFVDNLDKASALSTDQIDIENAERYDITYVDEKGERRRPLILHCSPSGAIERCVYAMLERAYREQKEGGVPALPLWLSPTQVRVIPVSEEFLEAAERLAGEIEGSGVRVDVDDRAITVPKRVREAEREWIPYIIVFGGRERASKTLPVRDREAGEVRKMRLRELVKVIAEKTADKPVKPLPLPKLLSKRPRFYG